MRIRPIPAMVSVALAIAAFPAAAADAPGSMYMNAGELKWGEAPPNLPKGAKIAVLSGDPGKPGAFVGRLMVPANYKIAPHYHSTDEDLTVISGTLYFAEGDKMETKGAHAIKAGGFHHLPARTHHYAFSKGPTVVQINANGPFDIVYINPDDDPSKKAAAAPAAAPATPKKK